MAIPQIPDLLRAVLAHSADVEAIPDTTPTGQGVFSYRDGWPVITEVELEAGGIAPDRKFFNEIYRLLSGHTFYTQSGNVYPWVGASESFPGLNYLRGAHVLGSDYQEYVAKKPSGPEIPAEGGGFVGPVNPVGDTSGVWTSVFNIKCPDNLTTTVDENGVLSVIGTRAPYTVPVAISPDAPLEWLPFERPMTADVDLYVSTTGNDLNDGSAAAPVATIAQALVLTRRYRRSPYKCIIHVAAGTYPGDFTVDFSRDYPVISIVGAGAATILPKIYAIFAGRLYVSSLTVTKTAAGNGEILLSGSLGASVFADSVIVTVGGVAASAVGASYGGSLTLTKSTLNSSGTAFSILLARGGYVFLLSTAITTNATVASGWAQADSNGLISTQGCTFAGTVTGPRYAASLNGVISTNGAGATYFPGSAAGNTFAGGQYS